ncbi:MAG: PLP-dependent aminotransferase family protein [Arenicella sp.]
MNWFLSGNLAKQIEQGKGPIYALIVESIIDAITDGSIPPGERLPSQRQIADSLGVNASTITKAYNVLEEQGFVSGEIGRGTYVRSLPDIGDVPWSDTCTNNMVDMSSNFPSSNISGEKLTQAIASISSDKEITELMQYHPECSVSSHIDSAKIWLSHLGLKTLGPRNVILTCGATHGGFICLLAITRPNDRILVESMTSPAIIGAANMLGLRLTGIQMDEHGILPEALEATLKKQKAKLLYIVPNMQNPTLSTIPLERRQAIIAIAKKHNLFIIEDDAYGALIENKIPPLAELDSSIVCYTTSHSKSATPGLRAGYLVPPSSLYQRALSALRVTTWMSSPLTNHIASEWIKDGTMQQFIKERRNENTKRIALARKILTGNQFTETDYGLHIWLKINEPWRATDFTAFLKTKCVAVLPSENFSVNKGYMPQYTRVSLCNSLSMEDLEQGLKIIALHM